MAFGSSGAHGANKHRPFFFGIAKLTWWSTSASRPMAILLWLPLRFGVLLGLVFVSSLLRLLGLFCQPCLLNSWCFDCIPSRLLVRPRRASKIVRGHVVMRLARFRECAPDLRRAPQHDWLQGARCHNYRDRGQIKQHSLCCGAKYCCSLETNQQCMAPRSLGAWIKCLLPRVPASSRSPSSNDQC
jgi:hypothetical protein